MTTKVQVTKVKRINTKAIIPTRAHETDSGWDLTVIGVQKIVGDTIYFQTGLQVAPPAGHYFEIYLRSSMASSPFMIAQSVGIIDNQYRGELIVPVRVLHPNIGSASEGRESYPSGMIRALDARPTSLHEVSMLILNKKPKLAQMIMRKCIDTSFEEVVDLDQTDRGAGGFGSSDQVR